ncbi:MAG: hypothetical protein J6Y02_24145 [Pseudobutyrivibrio sp.]|nr:hypothetical protein [Pseudobutyrivibrio sp.]
MGVLKVNNSGTLQTIAETNSSATGFTSASVQKIVNASGYQSTTISGKATVLVLDVSSNGRGIKCSTTNIASGSSQTFSLGSSEEGKFLIILR